MVETVERADAYEIVRGGAGDAPVVLTCEHASNRVPAPWRWPEQDRWLVNTHWAIDLGIGAITKDVAERLGATAVLSRFSRLLVDPNRPIGAPTLFRAVADGRDVHLNQDLTDAEREKRLARLYRPFHDAIDRVCATTPGLLVLSLHSFTPVYENAPPRWMEIGILFDEEEALAHRVAPVVRAHGLVTALNEPYSGQGGLMYSPQSHAQRAGRRALEIEVRQDRAINPGFRARIADALADMTRAALEEISRERPPGGS